jgi:hypothetical protein
MEHVIASYLKKTFDRRDWLFEGQHEFRPGYSCESQVIMVCQDTEHSLDKGDRIDSIVIVIGGSQSNVRSTARKCTGSTSVPCVRK